MSEKLDGIEVDGKEYLFASTANDITTDSGSTVQEELTAVIRVSPN